MISTETGPDFGDDRAAVDRVTGQLAGLPRVPVEVGNRLRAAHRIASRPVVRPGERSPTRRMARAW